jgi:hypothetical protein
LNSTSQQKAAQDRHHEARVDGRRPLAHEGPPDQPAQRIAEVDQDQAQHELLLHADPYSDERESVRQAQCAPGDGARGQPEPGVARVERHAKAGHCPEQHHPLDPKIGGAGALGDDGAEGGRKQDGARTDQHRDKGDECVKIHLSPPAPSAPAR